MKTKYQKPEIEVLNFYTENAVLLSVSGSAVDTKGEGFVQRGNKMDMWGNQNMWNK